MFTLGVVLTRLQRLATSAICTVKELITKKLFVLLGVLVTLKTRFVALCNSQLSPLVQTLKNIRAWHVNHTTAESLIKQEPTIAKVIHTVDGQQQATTAPPTLQPVTPQVKPKQRHAERTKSGRFAPKGTGIAPIPTDRLVQTTGKLSKTVANQLRQRAKQTASKGN